MVDLASGWAGKIFGTNTGNIFLEIKQDGNKILGRLRIMDDVFGVVVYDYTGTVGDEIIFNCTPVKKIEGMELGDVKVKAYLTSKGTLKGEWESTIGTAGAFEAFPHDLTKNDQNLVVSEDGPEQLYNRTIEIGSARLFKEDLIQLISFLEKDFTVGRTVITYKERGCDLTKFASSFLEEHEGIDQLNSIKIVIQEPEAHGINRVIVIELVSSDNSAIKVTGLNESWVIGKAESISEFLKGKQNSIATTYRKYGLNLNGLIFVVMLIVLPEIVKWKERAIFVVAVFFLLIFLLYIHNKFIPNTAIYLQQSKPSFLKRTWPSIFSWVATVFGSVIAAILFYVLTKSSS